MARSKAFSPSPPRSPAEDPQALAGERSKTDGSSPNAADPLSADDIDEQIRAYFAQDLE
jgi:hypothetical protein